MSGRCLPEADKLAKRNNQGRERGAWRPEVAKAISAVIKRYADGDINTQGWTFKVTDTTNEELPRG